MQCRQPGKGHWREPRAWQSYGLPQRRQQQKGCLPKPGQKEWSSRLPLQQVGCLHMIKSNCKLRGDAQLSAAFISAGQAMHGACWQH